MKHYDVTFLGHLCYDEVIHYDGSQSISAGGAALYGVAAAARLDKQVAAVIMLAPEDQSDLDILRPYGVDVFCIDAPQSTRVQVIHQTSNMDERRIVTESFAGSFHHEHVTLPDTDHLHLAGCNDHEFSLAFIQAIKSTFAGTLSVDLQSFARCNDPDAGEVVFRDDPNKQAIVSLMDKVKLDILEAKLFTGTDNLQQAAQIIQGWGCPEVMITSEEGVLACNNDHRHVVRFTNQSTAGRTGRGDTTFGSYLAARVDHDLPGALEIAAAVVSIKMETPGLFQGTQDQIQEQIKEAKRAK